MTASGSPRSRSIPRFWAPHQACAHDGPTSIPFRKRIYSGMAKHLVDIDEEALGAARAQLGTRTIRDTVNEALTRAAGKRAVEVTRSLDRLAGLELDDRDDAWR